jgi:DNA-binding MarR family transcriptional regulator
MPPPHLSADQQALLKELYRFYQANGAEACVAPKDLASRLGMDVGNAGAAIAGLYVKDLLILVDTEVGHLTRDGVIVATELFED